IGWRRKHGRVSSRLRARAGLGGRPALREGGMTANGGHDMALGAGRWTVERVGSRVRELAENVKQIADNLPRTQMPAVRMPSWVRLPEGKMTPAPRPGGHPLWVVGGGAPGAPVLALFLREDRG